MKKILILGATGAMGQYLVPEMLNMGWYVDAVALEDAVSTNPNLNYHKIDIKKDENLKDMLKNGYDAVVDFMIYPTQEELDHYLPIFLENVGHYIFLSSYRVYDETVPLTEESPRIIDTKIDADYCDDTHYCMELDYAIYKALGENTLRASKYNNWTIIRPAITYSTGRYQLTVLEARILMHRILAGKTVVLPESCMDTEGTMSWAGNVAQMIARLIENKKAYRETFTVSTSEHHKWREIAEMYTEITGMKYVTCSDEDFMKIIYNEYNVHFQQQLQYDRCLNRVVDNSKILEVTGLKQEDFMKLRDGLEFEYKNLDITKIPFDKDASDRMDKYLEGTL